MSGRARSRWVAIGVAFATVSSSFVATAGAATEGVQAGPVAAAQVGLTRAGDTAAGADPTEFAPDDGLVGAASPPRRDVAAVKRAHEKARQPSTRASSTEGSGDGSRPIAPSPVYQVIAGYTQSLSTPREVPSGSRPYESPVVTPPTGFGRVDDTGVRMFAFSGSSEVWNHPVGQAQYALANLNSYRITNDARYLNIALANAQRLVDRRVVSGDGWYYPYDFDFAVFRDTANTNYAPWYSAMAQGQALSVFVRLAEVTGAPAWREAADRTYSSLEQAPVADGPFVSWVDDARRLWLEEYPRTPAATSERVLNGQVFALFGLLDYLRIVGPLPQVLRLARGALSTAQSVTPSLLRRPSWASAYSVFHGYASPSYHPIHVQQFLNLWSATHDRQWVTRASLYRTDFPDKTSTGNAIITSRARTIYRLDSSYRVIQTRSVYFSRTTGAPVSERHRIKGGPTALKVSAGAYTGWWFPEARGVTWLRGATDLHAYVPRVKVVLAGGRKYSAYRLGASGAVDGSRTISVGAASTSAPSTNNALIEGRPAYRIDAGALAGYWLPEQPSVTVTAY